MMRLITTLMFVLVIYKTAPFRIICPQPSERYLRSKAKCTDYRNYTCLFDENQHCFRESCSVKFDFQRPGYRVTLRTNLHGGPCPDGLYQPFTFFTNISSNCELKRSFCSAQGQIVSSNGTTRTDRQCRCNYANGYSYVIKPKNICSCIPSEEDCSCYRKICLKNHILSPDYQCINQLSWSGKFLCSQISDLRVPKVTVSSNEIRRTEERRDVLEIKRTTVLLVIISITIIMLLTSSITFTLIHGNNTGYQVRKCDYQDDKQCVNNIETEQLEAPSPKVFPGQICWYQEVDQCVNDVGTVQLQAKSTREESSIDPHSTVSLKYVKENMTEVQIITRAQMAIGKREKKNETLEKIGSNTQSMERTEWEIRTKSFVETPVIREIKANVATINTVVLWGPPGCGKTASIHYIALYLQNHEGYKPIHCLKPSDIFNQKYQTGKRTFVIDDICGRFVFSHVRFLTWERRMKHIEELLQDDSVKLLMTCSSAVFITNIVQHCTLFTDNAFELTIPTILTNNLYTVAKDVPINSKHVLPSIIKQNVFDKVSLPMIQCEVSLPLRGTFDCFINSSEDVDSKVEQLRKSNISAFYSLFICILKTGSIDEAVLTSDDNSLFTELSINVCYTLDIDISRRQFLDNLYFLMDDFIFKDNGLFLIKHTALYEVLAVYFGDKLQKVFISYADSEIITQHCSLKAFKNIAGYARFSIQVDEENEDLYFQRITEQLLSRNIFEVFSVRQMSIVLYRKKLADFLKKQGPVVVKQISHSKCKIKNETCSSMAMRNGYVNLVKLFLDCNEDLNPENNEYLEVACKTGNLNFVKLLLSKQININKPISDGCTPLHIACKYGILRLMFYLVKNKAEVNCTDMHGNTPLIEACENENKAIISFLLENGADINKANSEGQFPLIIAIRKGRMRIVDVLISYRGGGNIADVNCTDMHGNTPLIEACEKGNEAMVSLLLKNRAEINKSNSEGQFPLMIAARKGRKRILDLLILKGADVTKVDVLGYTCLMHSIQLETQKIQTVLALLNAGVDVSCSSADGKTALLIAIQEQRKDIVKILTNDEADAKTLGHKHFFRRSTIENIVTKSDNHGMTPLIHACELRNDKFDVVEHLLSKGAIVNFCDDNDMTPLIVALQNDDNKLVKCLINNGALVNLPGNKRTTPLHEMCKSGQYNNVLLLISEGSEVDIVDRQQMTPLMLASKCGYLKIAQVLIKRNATKDAVDHNGTTALMFACMGGFIDVIRFLVEMRADVNKADKNNWTALLAYANSINDNAEIVNVLIEGGADLNSSTKDKVSSLMMACFHGHQEIVKCLLQHNVDVNHKDIYGKTPIVSACLSGNVDIVRVLLENGADTGVIDKNGDTLESLARKNNLTEMVDFFGKSCRRV
ncbi:uncharacterized protein LOC127715008 isoform X1 [Mytilus californianus]|uniref:uncharacterized protein LOC127715008 isoform X1 n=1 Tax=Mytilus californianus TaxID=6549 RepID=UPI0022478B14|nr:uncharacterized protein LOC127715008 isoform X1 [Mytilus californianus]